MEQRWAFLRPWVRPLRGRLAVRTVRYDADMLEVVEVRRLHKKEELIPAQYRKIRWGLLLLSLFARVDFAAWRHVVAMDCEFDPFNERDASLSRRLQIEKFCVSLMMEDEISDEFGWSKDVLLGLLSGLDELPPPGLIVAARRIARRSGVDLSTYEVPFIVLFEGGSEGCPGHVEALQAIRDEYGGWHFPVNMLAHQSEFRALEAAFTVDSVQYITETQVVSLDDQDALARLVSNSNNLVVSDVILNFEPHEIFYESLHFELQSIGGIIELIFRGSGVPTEKLAVVKRVLSLGGIIESFARRAGIPDPQLSKAQANMAVTHWANFVASAGGITVGCLLDVFPLLFMNHDDDDDADDDKPKTKAEKTEAKNTSTPQQSPA